MSDERETDKRPEEEKPAKPEDLKDENLDEVVGGGVISDTIKSIGDALGTVARKG